MKHVFEYLDEELKEFFEERAAIREFCGNMQREQAEEAARKEQDELAKRRKAIDTDKKGAM